MDRRHDPSISWLKKLEDSFKWEVRILYVGAVGCLMYMIHPLAGLALGAGGFLFVIVMDTAFSVLVTIIFLRPISEVLKIGRDAASQSQGYRRMQKRKWHTLIGSTLAVVSSTVLYINAILCFTIQGPFWEVPWLNIFVFGMNVDSILNDVGMLIVSGMINNVSNISTGVLRRITITLYPPSSVQPQPSNIFDSETPET
jgi:hypothetical protein